MTQRSAKPRTPVQFRVRPPININVRLHARVAELVYATDLKSVDLGLAGSSPAPGTTKDLCSFERRSFVNSGVW